MRRKDQLSIGEWAVLALLCERPAHGYAIAAAMAPNGELGRIWALGTPLTYRAIGVLRSMGLLEICAITPGDKAPNRTEMCATPTAHRRLSQWLATPERHVRDLRSSLLLKVVLVRRRGESPGPLLAAQAKILADQAEGLRAKVGEDAQERLIREWRLVMTEAAISFVDDTLEREA